MFLLQKQKYGHAGALALQREMCGWQIFEFPETARARGDGWLLLPSCMNSAAVLEALSTAAVAAGAFPCENGNSMISSDVAASTPHEDAQKDASCSAHTAAPSGLLLPLTASWRPASTALSSSNTSNISNKSSNSTPNTASNNTSDKMGEEEPEDSLPSVYCGLYPLRLSHEFIQRDLSYICCIANHMVLQLLHQIASPEACSSCSSSKGCCCCVISSVPPGSEEASEKVKFAKTAAAWTRFLSPVRLRPPLPFAVPPRAAPSGSTEATEGQAVQPPLCSPEHFFGTFFFSAEGFFSLPPLTRFFCDASSSRNEEEAQFEQAAEADTAAAATLQDQETLWRPLGDSFPCLLSSLLRITAAEPTFTPLQPL
ncbi:hypothetical protein cyc_08877 [Cyclospora cayetanensis]|uniref:Uncharacterized protein n=1 Tax=Cyclospora cayetanensis TaxID=88456 RepID=A0A1D3CXC4_9EIME|nr:hypothetical protein cyc_08877 [Cyclospora cayetanensis]